jgi:hypothetical protein
MTRSKIVWPVMVLVLLVTFITCNLMGTLNLPVGRQAFPVSEQAQGVGSSDIGGADLATTSSEAAIVATPASPTNPPAALTATPAGGLSQTPVSIVTTEQHFSIEREATSSQAALEEVLFSLRSARLTEDRLILKVALVNRTDQQFAIAGAFDERHAWLIDRDGNRYELLEASDNLKNVSPPGGFAPGAANVGELVFARPTGAAPYVLQFLTYQPIQFDLDTPIDGDAPVEVANQTYPLGVSLRSNQEALAPIVLQVQSLRLDNDRVIFEIGFANTSRQTYQLLVSPTGWDAWLLGAAGRQYAPVEVSPSLVNSVDPVGGWQPGQVHTGTITFPRPQSVAELRFIFPQYSVLIISFAGNGPPETRVTSITGGPPPPTPTLAPQEQVFQALDDLLAVQAEALQAENKEAYLATFAPDLRPEQETIFERAIQLPLASYQMRVASGAVLSQDYPERLENIEVQIRYALSGLPENNVFLHIARYTFDRAEASWQVGRVEADRNPPFWWTDDVIFDQTDHFLIFARPEMADELRALAGETESAYEALMAKGLPLQDHYAVYLSASQADFQELTGQEERVVGAAAWRYYLIGDQVTVSSRAFYLNGEAFINWQGETNAAERQQTVRHELVHLALADDTRPFTPSWLTEGVAVYFSDQNNPEARAYLVNSGELEAIGLDRPARDGSLDAHDLSAPGTEYEYIFYGEVINYLVSNFSEEQVLAFYRSYTRVPAAMMEARAPDFTLGSRPVHAAFADLSQEFTGQAVQEFFGLSLAELDAAVKIWLEEQVEDN